jgi:transcriptional regulator with PAS, ATPase and Fis domain
LYFIDCFQKKYRKQPLRISGRAIQKLMEYSWPGNVRELQHTIEKAVILCDTDVIKTEDLYLKQLNHFTANQPFITLQDMESRMIQQALDKNNGNYTAAAEQLGITRQTLYNRIKKSDR